jgi:hypothetical protein
MALVPWPLEDNERLGCLYAPPGRPPPPRDTTRCRLAEPFWGRHTRKIVSKPERLEVGAIHWFKTRFELEVTSLNHDSIATLLPDPRGPRGPVHDRRGIHTSKLGIHKRRHWYIRLRMISPKALILHSKGRLRQTHQATLPTAQVPSMVDQDPRGLWQ